MKKIIITLLTFSAVVGLQAQKLQVLNPGKITSNDVIITLPENKLPAGFNVEDFSIENKKQLSPIEQSVDIYGNISYISLINVDSKLKTINITKQASSDFPKRTYAELSHKDGGRWARNPKRRQMEYVGGDWVQTTALRVPDLYTDHSFYIRYEGPGWESDKVGYRFYLDWRNANDIFGKTKPDICLPKVGLDGYDSYHNMQDWGMDVFKVGSTLGIGSFGYWDGKKAIRVEIFDSLYCEIPTNGKLRSQVRTTYSGWDYSQKGTKTTLTSLLTIDAGSRATYVQLLSSESVPNICTGLIKDNNAEYIQKDYGDWTCIATYGQQSLNNDNLGVAVFVRTKNIEKITEDKLNWVVVLNPENQKFLDYYFLAAWELEPDGIKTKEAFETYLDSFAKTLNNPINVK